MKAEYDTLDAVAMADLVARRELHPNELLDIALQRVAELNPRINAVVIIREALSGVSRSCSRTLAVKQSSFRATTARGFLLWSATRGTPRSTKEFGTQAS
jgi:hypothetical protein